MEVRSSGRLHSGGFDQLSAPVAGSVGRPVGSAIYSTVQQQDYSASVWLRRKDKLEHSQQKCIVIFALVCCFAILLALIFSAVDLWGDEDGITEENCNRNCRVVLVENIPEDIYFLDNGTAHMPLSMGLHSLLNLATRSVDIVSPQWALNSSDYEASFLTSARQGRALLYKLLGLKARKVNLKIASGMIDSAELKSLDRHSADVHYVNMTALTRGQLHSSFWVVDRKHMYIGSGSMDWRSLATRKELGIIIYDCSCLALDLHRVFNLYWQLQYKDFIPSIWSKRLYALYNKDETLSLLLNSTKADVYVSTSPEVLCPKDRTRDLEAISRVIQEARKFIYISITDYLPLINTNPQRYWSRIDGMVREALILRNVRVRLLVSCWEQTHPLTFNFVWSLKTLCMQQTNCSLEVKFFSPSQQWDGTLHGINHNRFMVTDRAVYIGNLDWVGNEFAFNGGAGMVINQAEGVEQKNLTIVDQMRAIFDRDWYSHYTRTLQSNKIPVCNKHQINRLAPLKAIPIPAGNGMAFLGASQSMESSGSRESSNGSL